MHAHRSLGSQVIEQGDAFEKDMWEDPKFEQLGTFGEKYFLLTLVVLELVCGGIAAGTCKYEGCPRFVSLQFLCKFFIKGSCDNTVTRNHLLWCSV
jgi:hypothetical protein